MRAVNLSSDIWLDDALRWRAFAWLTRIGAGRRFDTMPIGWYQAHQCHALDVLKALSVEQARCHQGWIQRRCNGAWANVMTPRELFIQADSLTRG